MKITHKIFAISLVFFALNQFSFAQKAFYFGPDATVNVNDSVVIRLNDYRGDIQWQKSLDLENWENIDAATRDTLLFVADTTSYFRAEVVAGDCDPFYSDTTMVGVFHVFTSNVAEITDVSAVTGGIIIAEGGSPVTARGVVWGTTPNPTIENNQGYTTDGNGLGEFTSNLTGLTPETTYYVRAYATNIAGTGYGADDYFTTLATTPDAYTITLQVSPPGTGQVSGAGEYTEGTTITITATPIANYQFVNWTGDTEHITDASATSTTLTMPAQNITLTANFDEVGGGNGEPGAGVTDIDGNFYPSVIIGNQEWMAENLRVTRDAIGNDITRYCYNNDTANCDLYGGLYTWHTVMNGATSSLTNPSNVQGICPTGWHLPSDSEWYMLVNCLVEQGYPNAPYNPNGAGKALKSCRQVSSPLGGDCATSEHPRWDSQSTHYGSDVFVFSALPGGYRNTGGLYRYLGSYAGWWSSTDHSATYALSRALNSGWSGVGHSGNDKDRGFSIRCVRDID